MKYQLWNMVSYGKCEPLQPLTLINESDSFEEIYNEFNKKTKQEIPCVIFIKNELLVNENKTRKIYESPDGGKTIYERGFGDYLKREKIN